MNRRLALVLVPVAVAALATACSPSLKSTEVVASVKKFSRDRGNARYFEILDAQITKIEEVDGTYKAWLLLEIQMKLTDFYVPGLNVIGLSGHLENGTKIVHPVVLTLRQTDAGLETLKVAPQ